MPKGTHEDRPSLRERISTMSPDELKEAMRATARGDERRRQAGLSDVDETLELEALREALEGESPIAKLYQGFFPIQLLSR